MTQDLLIEGLRNTPNEAASGGWNCYQLGGGDCHCDYSGAGSLSCQVPASGTPTYQAWALSSTGGRCRAKVVCSNGSTLICNARSSSISTSDADANHVECTLPSGQTTVKNCP